MAAHDVQSRPNANGVSTVAEPTPPPRKDAGWFVEFSDVLSDLSVTMNQAFLIIGVITITATAVAYWGAYTEHYYIAVGAMAVFGLSMLAWTIATLRMLWVVISGSYRWWANRRSGSPGEFTDNGPG